MPHDLPKSYEPGAIEARWAEYWVKERLFSVPTPDVVDPKTGDPRPVFSLLLPPPNVTGRLHMGHMLNQTQMDIIMRWHRMRGDVTLWLPGTDHAGIATQMMVERQLATEGKKRSELGREQFIERVWGWKKQYGSAIQEQMRRLGASVDWSREYFTMDENLSRAVREVFVRLHEEGLIYRGKYIVNWCPRCETAISDLEVKHEEIPGKLWEIRYPVVGCSEFITVATTRPETMLGDAAVAVNEKDERYTHLHGKKVLLPLMNREIPIITDELAQPEFGTGAVKVTPAHDPNDFEAGLRHNLPQIEVMDAHGHMNENAGPYAGLDRYAARKRVLEDLQAQGFLVGEKAYTITIGKCDRCGTVVEPRLSTQWFIKIKPLAERAIEVVEKDYIRFTPANYRTIYLNWMRNIHDWTISRQLWWGHRIPAWHCACGEIIVARKTPSSCGKCGGELKQDPDVLDTWFSSGLLPFTSLGWPEATRDLEVFYPTSLLITGFDILFFWVARMIMLGCWFMAPPEKPGASAEMNEEELRASVPFREVYIHALVRDAERQKMSKTKGNVLDPIQVIEKYGTDATRFTLAAMSSPGTDIAFNESRTDGYRAFANKIWNAARFMFMNVDRIKSADPSWRLPRMGEAYIPLRDLQLSKLEDRWIFSRFNRAIKDVNESLQTYRFDEAANRIYDFFWGDFCDWYIELIKPRLNFEEGGEVSSAKTACTNLVTLFDASLRLLHPFMPFITEEIWHAMYNGEPELGSIAKAAYPSFNDLQVDMEAEYQILIVQDLIVNVRNLRVELKVEQKTKAPVQVFTEDAAIRSLIEQNRGAVERLANAETVTFAEKSLSNLAGARSTARFDVHVIYEKKIDVEAERKRATVQLHGLIAEKERLEKQLANEGFLKKAPENVITAANKRVEELEVLIGKSRGMLLDWLGTTEAKVHHYIPQFYLEGFLDKEQVARGQNLLWVYEAKKVPRLCPTSKAAAEVDFYSFEDAGEIKKTTEAVLSKLESHTAPVFRRLVARDFAMTPLERSEFAGFIAMTFCRTPFFLKSIEKMSTEFHAYMSRVMATTPGALEHALGIVELRDQKKSDVSADALREFLLSERYTVKLGSGPWLAKMMFQMMLDLMPIIERMQWNWLLSGDEYFVTADHPISLYDQTAGSLYGPGFMSSEDAEFTFPLSRDVCLYCRWKGGEHSLPANGRQVRRINKRTISWATRYVYAAERSLKLAKVVDAALGTEIPVIKRS